MNENQKMQLRQIAKMTPRSFPNGSSYKMQEIPKGETRGIKVRAIKNVGYLAEFPDGDEVTISFDRQSVGPGTDLGIHFNTRDQVLSDLL